MCCRRRAVGKRLSTGQSLLIVRVSHSKEKCRHGIKPFLHFWSEWRDSNSRHPGPKKLWELFQTISAPFWCLLFRKSCSLKLSSPLFPCAPNPVMVKYVVKTASRKIREAVRSFLRIGIPVSGSIIVSGKHLNMIFLHYSRVQLRIIYHTVFAFEQSVPHLPLHFVCSLR